MASAPAYPAMAAGTESIYTEAAVENTASHDGAQAETPQDGASQDETARAGTAEADTALAEITQAETTLAETAADSPREDPILVEPDGVDANGYVTQKITVADKFTLPVTVTMKSSEGSYSFTVDYQGKEIKLKPAAYKITKAVDGNGKKLAAGATLVIPETSGETYLDFTSEKTHDGLLESLLTANIAFIPIAVLAFVGFRYLILSQRA